MLNRKLAPAICTDPSSPSRMFPALRSLQTNTDTDENRCGSHWSDNSFMKSIIIKTYLRGIQPEWNEYKQYECVMFLYVSGTESIIQTSVVMVTNSLQTIWTLYPSLCPVFNTQLKDSRRLLSSRTDDQVMCVFV